MNVNGQHFRTIWTSEAEPETVRIIDQRHLPYRFVVEDISDAAAMAVAIEDMHVRGAGLIGAAAGYGMYLAALEASRSSDFQGTLEANRDSLKSTRPTAVNLEWALQRQMSAMEAVESVDGKIRAALRTAEAIADEDARFCQRIGEHGLTLLQEISKRKEGGVVNILTHCNAGWLAFVDYGSATAPIYAAFDAGMDIHVYVDETRPRNQGARLTAWELGQHGVSHTVIPDNAGGHLMQRRMVDLVITGTDRTTFTGDVANKVGTYLKALAAHDNEVPFYVALPSSTFDWNIRDGVSEIPIEERGGEEVKYIDGWLEDGEERVLLTPPESPVANYAFDVTPARLVTGLITERGFCEAKEDAILSLFPEKRPASH